MHRISAGCCDVEPEWQVRGPVKLDATMRCFAVGNVEAVGIAEEEIVFFRIERRKRCADRSEAGAGANLVAVQSFGVDLANRLVALQTVEVCHLRRAGGAGDVRINLGVIAYLMHDAQLRCDVEKAVAAVRRAEEAPYGVGGCLVLVVVARPVKTHAGGHTGGRGYLPFGVQVGRDNGLRCFKIIVDALRERAEGGAALRFLEVAVGIFKIEARHQRVAAFKVDVKGCQRAGAPVAGFFQRLIGYEVA